MQPVQEQEMGDEVVVDERLQQVIVCALDDAGETFAVEIHQLLHQLERRRPRRGIGEGVGLVEQRLDPGRVSHAHRTSASAPA
jgi:hypothetical protein